MTGPGPSSRPPIDVDALLASLVDGDDEAVVETFRGRTESERRKVAPALLRLREQYQLGLETGIPRVHPSYWDTSVAAMFACCTLTELQRLDTEHRFGQMCNDTTLRVLVDRRPGWARSWVAWACERQATKSGRAFGLFVLVRKLVLAGVCDPPDSDAYVLAMVFTDDVEYDQRSRWHWDPRDDPAGSDPERSEQNRRAIDAHQAARRPVLRQLLDDPALIDGELWRIFDITWRPSRTLSHTSGQEWITAFVSLAATGRIDRARVLGCTLDALALDTTNRLPASFFVALWRDLEPTLAERADHQGPLVLLLDHSCSTTAAFALDALDELERDGALDVPGLVRGIEGLLLTMSVTIVRHALSLLDRIAGDRPDLTPDVLVAVASALLHANPNVHAAALHVLREHAQSIDATVAAAVESAAGLASTEVSSELQSLTAQPLPGT